MKNSPFSKTSGFTLIEVLTIVSLLSTILVFSSINLFSPVQKAKLDTTSADINSIIREAQNKAISSDTSGVGATDNYGIHFESDKYVLFKGSSYNVGDPNNFVVNIPEGVVISQINLPSGNVVFRKLSGEVINFDNNLNNICIQEAATGQTVVIRLNFIGVADVVEQNC